MKMSNDSSLPKIPYEEARDAVILWKKGRKKKPDPIYFVNAVWNLVNYHHLRQERNPFDAASRDVKDISPRMLRKLVTVAELANNSKRIEKLLSMRKLSLDVASDLAGIKNEKLRENLAEIIAGMKAHDQRQVVKYIKKYPESSIEQFKNRVLLAKDTTEKIYMAVLPFNEKEYVKLKNEARLKKMSWDELCMDIITKWLEKGGNK